MLIIPTLVLVLGLDTAEMRLFLPDPSGRSRYLGDGDQFTNDSNQSSSTSKLEFRSRCRSESVGCKGLERRAGAASARTKPRHVGANVVPDRSATQLPEIP